MANDKAGNTPWKERLDLLAEVPGEAPADKEAVWQRLQERLQRGPRRKGFPVYWLAAACMLLAICLPRLLQNHPESSAANPEVHLPGHRSPVSISREQPPTIVRVEGSRPKKVTRPLPEKPSGRSVKGVSGSVVAAPVIQPLRVEAPAVTMSGPADTIQALAGVPAPKKLRVVHINELGGQPGESAAGRMAGAPYLQARLANPEDFSRFTISHNNSDNILKIKISPSN